MPLMAKANGFHYPQPLSPSLHSPRSLFSPGFSDSASHEFSTPPTSPPKSPPSETLPTRLQEAPRSPVKIRFPSVEIQQPYAARIENGRINTCATGHGTGLPRGANPQRPGLGDRQESIRRVSSDAEISEALSSPLTNFSPSRSRDLYHDISESMSPPPGNLFTESNASRSGTPTIQIDGLGLEDVVEKMPPQLQYHHNLADSLVKGHIPTASQGTTSTMQTSSSDQTMSSGSSFTAPQPRVGRKPLPRPESAFALGTNRGRSLTPPELRTGRSLSPPSFRMIASPRQSPDMRPLSYIDLLNTPYSQQVAQQNVTFDNARLRGAVGTNAALLDTRKTLEMYRANVKKTNDSAVQYEFAILLVNAAQEAPTWAFEERSDSPKSDTEASGGSHMRAELLKEARHILSRLADRSYVFAQYYLADGYASGLFNKGKEDYDRAFPLFVSAGKHGHAESGYRAALCYEFGWGCRKDYAKAVQFYRQSSSKNHPGAATRLGRACLTGDMGLAGKFREGIKWLKRASESADAQHNSAPYELGLLHTTGYGDVVFKDEGYAAQLFTQAAELGHPEANLKMGEAYEHGLLTCPRDPALSIHFYTGAAQAGSPQAMMALCAWYMVGAQPILEKDEIEAYEWAKKAAEMEFVKAEYAVGYFTEMGIGCRRDLLEANVWYVKAADQGDQRASQRLAIIRAAQTGDQQDDLSKVANGTKKKRSIFDWRGKSK